VHKAWAPFAKSAKCVAFDADDREFEFMQKESEHFKTLLIVNKIVVADGEGKNDFYLTKSPYCSSTLKPSDDALACWDFAELFELDAVTQLETVSLVRVLEKAGLDYVDWFKTDSQGTDLRLFQSLPQHVREGVTVAEFEPGIIDAYQGEDKLHALIRYMDGLPFWMDALDVKGTGRIRQSTVETLFEESERGYFAFENSVVPPAPAWAEVSYINKLEDIEHIETRNLLLGCLFGLVKNQTGWVLELAHRAEVAKRDDLFAMIRRDLVSRFRSEIRRRKARELPGRLMRMLK